MPQVYPASEEALSYGKMGGWINGRWHPHGGEAARTGAEPPVEQTYPANPAWTEKLKAMAKHGEGHKEEPKEEHKEDDKSKQKNK